MENWAPSYIEPLPLCSSLFGRGRESVGVKKRNENIKVQGWRLFNPKLGVYHHLHHTQQLNLGEEDSSKTFQSPAYRDRTQAPKVPQLSRGSLLLPCCVCVSSALIKTLLSLWILPSGLVFSPDATWWSWAFPLNSSSGRETTANQKRSKLPDGNLATAECALHIPAPQDFV